MPTTGYFLNQYFTTTLNVGGGINNSQTTGIIISNVSGIDTTKPGIALINYADPLNTSIAEWVTYTSIDGSKELQGVTRGAEGYSAKPHDNGVSVAFPLSESHINNLATALSIGGNATNLVTTTIDDDTMATATATSISSSESIKAYVDSNAGIANVVEDTTPQLGGDLDVNGHNLTNSTANHIVITPGTNKLVKVAVLRKDITSDSYVNNSVILTGWSYITTAGGDKRESGSVSFGITFSSAPIVIASMAGLKASDPAAITELGEVAGAIGDVTFSMHSYGVSTTGFSVQFVRETANMTNGWRLGYSWIAVGVLS